jgi:hypothetical protein
MVRPLQLKANKRSTIIIQIGAQYLAANETRMRIVRCRTQMIAGEDGNLVDECVNGSISVRELARHPAGLVIINVASDLDLQIMHAAILDPINERRESPSLLRRRIRNSGRTCSS